MSSRLDAEAARTDRSRVRTFSFTRGFITCLGVLLLAFTVLPLFRLLDRPETGLAGEATAGLVGIYYDFAWSGALLVVLVSVLSALFLRGDGVERGLNVGRTWLLARSQPGFAAALASLTMICAAAFSLLILDGVPNQIDSIAQMLHARFWAEGRLAGPASDGGGFWAIQNALFTPDGWVSQYPPGHVAVLALSVMTGLPWLGNALLAGLTVFMTALFAERILGKSIEARLGSILLATSTFFICISGSFMNHVTTAAAITSAAFAWTRAWQGGHRWAYAAGAMFAWGVLTRPLSTLVAALVLVPGIPLATGSRVHSRAWTGQLLRAAAGAAPFMIALFAYNAHFFGHPFRLGYDLALGPAMGLGFHQDPWGNSYGIREAIGYTSADLVTLSVSLFETPMPSLLVIGAFLISVRALTESELVIALWAVAAVVGNFFYWHHGQFMGPRMLHESAPAWALLFAISTVGLYRRLTARSNPAARFDVRSACAGAIAFSFLIGFGYLVPQRVASYGGGWLAITRVPLPETDDPALVFVHDGWMSRLAMQLAATGMSLDKVETALRQNSTCLVQQYVDARDSGNEPMANLILARLDMSPRASGLPPENRISVGNYFRHWPDDPFTVDCKRQVDSDRNGVFDLAPLLAQGELPGSQPNRALFVRDLGPEKNQRLIAEHPSRTPYIYALQTDRTQPVLMRYEEGIRALWGRPGALAASPAAQTASPMPNRLGRSAGLETQ